MTIYIYIKTHNITNLKYLGKTIYNPHLYKGSGKYWKRHIKKYGNDVTTEILGAYESEEELRIAGIYFSRLYNVVSSKEWANLKEESGNGGARPFTKEERERLSDIHKVVQNRPDVKENNRKKQLLIQKEIQNRPEVKLKKSQKLKGLKRTQENKDLISLIRSIPIKVVFLDKSEMIFKNRLELGKYLKKSAYLGSKLVYRPDLWEKYNILNIIQLQKYNKKTSCNPSKSVLS